MDLCLAGSLFPHFETGATKLAPRTLRVAVLPNSPAHGSHPGSGLRRRMFNQLPGDAGATRCSGQKRGKDHWGSTGTAFCELEGFTLL